MDPLSYIIGYKQGEANGGGSGDIDVVPITITENGLKIAPSGKAYSPVNVNVSGGGDPGLLDDFDAQWSDRSTDPSDSTAVINEDGWAVLHARGLAILSTNDPIDFSNYTKLKIKVANSKGTNPTSSRLSISNNIIDGSNRGNVYVTFSKDYGIFELTLPQEKSALYVGILCWSWSDLVVIEISAE